jgi:DedD protein
MEDQKLLWIVFSVVLFAVVVLASVLYFLKPQAAEPAVAAVGGSQPAAAFDTYEYVRGASPVLPVRPSDGADRGLEIVVGEAADAATAPATEALPATKAEPRSVDQPAASPVAPAAPKAAARAAASPKAGSPAAAPAPAAPAAKPQASQPSKVYWIQTASFRSRGGAEAMVGTLGQKGITGRIQVSDQSGQPYYRVRVGPYTSRDEAEKFLSWIKGVKGLEQSYISAVTRSDERAR